MQTLISMAHAMNIKVVAEGVETREQLDLLGQYTVDEVQGNLISKPVSPTVLESMLLDSASPGVPSNVVQLRPG